MSSSSALKIGVLGAGAVGCYVGGRLAASGVDVVFVGRARAKEELLASGLTAIGLDGRAASVDRARLVFTTDPSALGDRDVVLCCVKSAQSAEAAEQIARGPLVVSLQNGVRNPEVLRARLGDANVLGGIVGFNVVSKGDGRFRCATSGPIAIEASADPRADALATALAASGVPVTIEQDLPALQWAKLVMNLNNAVSALSDLPTSELLTSEGYRRVLGAIMKEALDVLRRARIRPARFGAIPVQLFPVILALPTPLFRLVARAQLRIDPEARSSMWEDLTKGRLTEVDYLNGEIVRLAASCGAAAPINARVVEVVHDVEKAGRGSPGLSADALWDALTRAPR